MTEKQIFIDFLIEQHFSVKDDFIGFVNIIPHYQKTTDGDHVLPKELIVTFFSGKNTKEGELGCVTFCYHGAKRRKYCKRSWTVEMLKKVFCPKGAADAIETFKKWQYDSEKTRQTWQTIL